MRGLVLVATLILAIIALWMFRSFEIDPPTSAGAVEAELEGTVAQGQTAPQVIEPVAPARLRSELAPDAADTAGEVLYDLRVVRGADLEPVPGAAVRWLPAGFDFAALPEGERGLLQRDREVFVIRHGQERTADAEGRVTLRGPTGGMSVLGRDGDWYGQTFVRASDPRTGEALEPEPEYLLQLQPDQTLVVRAVDSDGVPVPDVTVRLTRTLIENGEKRETHMVGMPPPTDEQGLTRWPHVQTTVYSGQVLDSARIAAVLLGGMGDPVPVDLFSVPDDPVEVVLPPFGSIEIALLGPDGNLWRNVGETRVDVVNVAEMQAEMQASKVYRIPTVLLHDDGRGIASPVLCGGGEFRIGLSGEVQLDTTVDGPRLPGERVQAELRMPADIPILTGRVVDEDGAPASGSFYLQLENQRGASVRSKSIGTDASGHFRTALRLRTDGQTLSIILSRGSSPLSPAVVLQMSAPIHAGVNDIGDLVLGRAPILVAGRMEWADGTPAPYPRFGLDYRTEGRWELHNLHPELPGDGSFIVRGQPRGREYRLRPAAGFAPTEPVEFQPGTEDLVIRVEKGASVEVTVLADSPVVLNSLRYDLVSRAPPPPADDFQLTLQRRDLERGSPTIDGTRASCRWTGLAAGPHRLTIACPGMPPLVDLDLDVPRGAPVEDLRLRDIDLRGLIRTVTVTVLDAGGNAVRATRDDAGVMFRGQPGPEAEWYGRALDGEDGRIQLHVPTPVDLAVFAPGYRTQEVPGVFSDVTVRLEPAPQVRLRLASPLPALPEDTTVNLAVAPTRAPGEGSPRVPVVGSNGWALVGVEDRLGRGEQGLRPERDGAFVLDARGGGVVSLHLELVRRMDGRLQRAPVVVQPSTLDLAAMEADRVIELTVDPLSLQKALDGIGR